MLPRARRIGTKAYPCREAGGFVWVWMGSPAKRCANSSRRRGRRRPTSAPASSRSMSAATGRRCSKARSIPRTARACIRPTWCRRRSTAPARHRPNGCVLPPTRRRACRCSAPTSAFATWRSAVRSTTTSTHDYLRITLFVAPFTVLIPPNDRYNLSILNIPQDDTNTMFYFIAWSDRRRHRPGGVAQVLRRAGRRRPRRGFPPHPHARQQLPAGSRGDETGSHTGIDGHSQPGHRDVGNDGTDRRSLARAARRERRRDRRSSAASWSMRRARCATAGPAIGTVAAARTARQAEFVRRHRARRSTRWTTLGVADEELALRQELAT